MSNVKKFRIIKFKSKPILAAKSISKSFSGRMILRKVDVHLNQGEMLGLLGSNGAGKSTFMNIERSSTTKKEINIVCFTSDNGIPNGVPYNICIKSISLVILDIRTIPRAKKPVKTNPITVSSLILDLCLINPMRATEPTPKTKAPIDNGTPIA